MDHLFSSVPLPALAVDPALCAEPLFVFDEANGTSGAEKTFYFSPPDRRKCGEKLYTQMHE